MKKALFLSAAMLTLFAGIGFSQQSVAPDQPAGVVETTNAAAVETNAPVTAEREVVVSNGVVYNDGRIDYVSPEVKFVINARDNGSGVKKTFVMVDDSQFGTYERPVGFITEGKHLIAYKTEDNVGNISPFKYYEFIMDKTAPFADLTSDRKWVKMADVVYIGSNYNFGIFAMDTLSGVKSIEYTLDGGSAVVYDKPFAAVGTNGFHQVVYTAADNVGNVSEKKTFTFFMDVNAPALEFSVDQSLFETNGVKYISARALVKIDAVDAETGVDKVVYTIDGGEALDYTHPIQLTSGQHTIKAKAYDLLGNVSEEKEFAVTVDTDTPEADLVPTK